MTRITMATLAILVALTGSTSAQTVLLNDTFADGNIGTNTSAGGVLATLAAMAEPGLRDLFREVVEHDPDLDARCEAMQGLGLLGAAGAPALPALRARAASPDDRERSYATTAIRRIEAAIK